jgi:hypothetical protein
MAILLIAFYVVVNFGWQQRSLRRRVHRIAERNDRLLFADVGGDLERLAKVPASADELVAQRRFRAATAAPLALLAIATAGIEITRLVPEITAGLAAQVTAALAIVGAMVAIQERWATGGTSRVVMVGLTLAICGGLALVALRPG